LKEGLKSAFDNLEVDHQATASHAGSHGFAALVRALPDLEDEQNGAITTNIASHRMARLLRRNTFEQLLLAAK